MDRFPATRHSVVERIRTADAEARRLAFGDLVQGYWRPVYTHLRLTWRLSSDQAQDLTQGFFTDAFQKGWIERFDPSKGRFRTFIRVCADRCVLNARQADGRIKRGGGTQMVPLDYESAERDLVGVAPSATDPDLLFHQEFVRALFQRALAALRKEFGGDRRTSHLALFERYDLAGETDASYAQLAREFGLTTTQVTNRLAQVRRRFRELATEELRGLCGTDEEFRREARDLFGLEVE